jgi:hypothetical protein
MRWVNWLRISLLKPCGRQALLRRRGRHAQSDCSLTRKKRNRVGIGETRRSGSVRRAGGSAGSALAELYRGRGRAEIAQFAGALDGPIARYFIFVGGALAALLFIAGWCLPTPRRCSLISRQLSIERSSGSSLRANDRKKSSWTPVSQQ